MANLTKPITDRLVALIGKPPDAVSHGGFRTPKSVSETQGWIVSAASLIATVVADPKHPYRQASQTHLNGRHKAGELIDGAAALLGMLQHLQMDFDAGLLSNIETQISAQTFDDMLDHAESYLKERRHEPAGVLAGVVFEDTVRKLCDKHNIPQDDIKLDTLLSELVKAGVITALERKEGTTSAALRTSATHARWTEFGLDQAETVVRFTRRLIREKLAT